MSDRNESTNHASPDEQSLSDTKSGDRPVDNEKTWLHDNAQQNVQKVSAGIPSRMGRYEVRGLLGHGSFGQVLLAHDANLDRLVAIKIPRLDRFRSDDSLQSFLEEARTVARLRHPGIVVVHDVGQESKVPYIVMEYIRGRSLSDYLRLEKVSFRDAARLVRQIADALAHAHSEGFVHRDLKPANILLDNEDMPHISDFGLALRYREAMDLTNRRIGTPQYMAPEQAAGENHRIDERTDIWALGAIFYLALCGRKPFSADDLLQLQEQIVAADYVPLSHWDPKIPRELQRICERCMARRMTDRYRYANELVVELDEWLQASRRERDSGSFASSESNSAANSGGATLVPRGLRPFEPQDAHLFSRLLPGPWDREGCNATLRFLKTSIEQTDSEQTFAVGLLYGPSGSGKSSLVRAAVIPRIAGRIKVVYVDANAANMEQRLKSVLHRQFEGLSKTLDLSEMLFELREQELLSDDGKVLLVIDQFEQWLARGQVNSDCELVRALRQCDGGRLQCLLTVRDDFWLPICRFMNLLEFTIVDGQNACLIDAFDVDHARKVLVELGVAYGCLPENRHEITAAQNAFLDRSISELTEDDRLFPIRLTVFVEMVRKQPWQVSTLDRLGGVGGIGVAFLEHAIGGLASSARQIYTESARNVFASLLPARGLIKGSAVRREVLLNASGYKESPRDFDQLMRLLDSELRLLTPLAMDDDLQSSDPQSSSGDAEPRYQLTHDFLIPSIRAWLERDLRSTPSGRLQLMLQEQAELWSSRPSARYLPSIVEWLQYSFRTNRRHRTESQRRMLEAATQRIRNYVLAGGFVAVLVSCVVFFVYQAIRDAQAIDQSKVLASALQEIEIRDVPEHVAKMQPLWKYVEPLVKATYDDADESMQRRSRAAVAILSKSREPSLPLAGWLLSEQFPVEDVAVALAALVPHADLVAEEFTRVLENQSEDATTRLRAVVGLAGIGRLNVPALKDPSVLQEVSLTLLHQPYPDAMIWIHELQPLSAELREPLRQMTLEADELEPTRIGFADSTRIL
ncbi:MAG: serine/threonine-protein kinase [Planctomycetaceae bacterium]